MDQKQDRPLVGIGTISEDICSGTGIFPAIGAIRVKQQIGNNYNI